MSFEEYRNRGRKNVIHPEDRDEVEKEWQKCVNSGRPWVHEYRIKDREGRYHTVLSRGAPQADAEGKITSWTGVDIDISERRKAEDALKEAYDNLDKLVRNRTRELILTNENLTREIGVRRVMEKQLEVRGMVLGFLSQTASRKEYLDSVAGYLKNWLGCGYLGIRIIDKEKKIPFEAYEGFPRDFLETEKSISLVKDNCICVRVSAGKYLPADAPYLTAGRSFYSGDIQKLPERLNEEEKKYYRGACIRSGFSSLAVVPIVHKDDILGVIHIADREKNKFSPEDINVLEQLNILIGEGVTKFNLSDEIKRINEELEARVFERTRDLRKFQLAVQNASDLIIITDLEGKIVFANSAAKKLTGYEIEEIIGRAPSLWGGEAAEDFFAEIFSNIRETRVPYEGEIDGFRKNKEKFIGQVHISPVFGDNEEVIFFAGIIRDITRSKEIDQAKSEFISMASHQLRTPLTGIGLSAELLKRGIYNQLDEKQKNYIKEIQDSSRRMAELIGALLNISRIEMGTFMLKPENIDVSGYIERILEELSGQVHGKKLSLEKKLGDEPLKSNFDANTFRIIFENLVTNAVRYTPAGGKIFVEAKKNNRWISIYVKDTGGGIEKDDLEKIFLKSYRSEKAKEISSEGAGLGLYIARSVAEKAGAKIRVESQVGLGSTFTFELPINE